MQPSPADEGGRGIGARTPARRGVWCAAMVLAGMCAAGWCDRSGLVAPGAWVISAALACAVIGGFSRGWPARLALAISAVLLGAGWFTSRALEVPADSIARVLTDEARVVRIVGVVSSDPEPADSEPGALGRFAWDSGPVTRLRVAVRALEGVDGTATPARGDVWVRVRATSIRWRIGDTVRVIGMGAAVRGARNPGEPDWTRWARAHGIAGTLRVDDAELVQPADVALGALERAGWAVNRWVGAVRMRARDAFGDTGAAALERALVLGDRADGFDDIQRAFQRVGVAHVVAISGMHVAILMLAVIAVVRVTGDHPRAEALVIAAALATVMILVPARSPVVRAVVIVAALRAGRVLGRRWDSLNMLGWVMCAVMAWQPMEVWNPGFQLSFGIVGALVWLVGPVRDRILGVELDPDHRTPLDWVKRWAVEIAAAGFIAWAVSAPMVAAHFGTISLWAPVMTIVTAPFMVVAVALGYLGVGAHLVLGGAGAPAAAVAMASADGMLTIVRWADNLPGAWIPGAWVTCAWAACATVAIVTWLRLERRAMGRWVWAACAATVGIIAWGAVEVFARGPGPTVAARIDALDVGDGSAILVRASRGAVMFDCGSRWFGIGERTIPDAVRSLRSPMVRTLIVSHQDTDHYCGVLDAVEPLGVRRVIVTPRFLAGAAASPEGPAAAMLTGLREKGIAVETVSAGDAIDISATVRMEVLWPPEGYEGPSDNDDSIVVMMRVQTELGERRILLTGDIERSAIEGIEHAHPDLRTDIMEAPHHGSARPFAMEFVQRVDPRVVLQSTGPSRLGDARWDAVKRDRTWIVTAESGCATATIGRDGSVRGWGFRSARTLGRE